MSSHKCQVNLDPHTKTKYFSIPTQKHVNSDPYTEFKSISIPTIKSSQFWCRDTKTKLITIPTLNLSLFRLTHKNQVKFGPPHKPSQFRSKY